MSLPYRPRLSVEISVEQFKALQVIPHGLKKPLFLAIINNLINLLSDPDTRHKVITAIVNEQFNLPREIFEEIIIKEP